MVLRDLIRPTVRYRDHHILDLKKDGERVSDQNNLSCREKDIQHTQIHYKIHTTLKSSDTTKLGRPNLYIQNVKTAVSVSADLNTNCKRSRSP